jgi:hypothetical protein
MSLLPADTPLYNHPLPQIEDWLSSLGCEQDNEELHCWYLAKSEWKAQVYLDIEELIVEYFLGGEDSIARTFKYSLSRVDVENAILAGP